VRELLGLRPTPEFEQWLIERGRWADGRLVPPTVATALALQGESRRMLER